MKHKSNRKQIWVAVKVERGFISDAKAYESFDSAKQAERRWRSSLNPDYDESTVISSPLISRPASSAKIRRRAKIKN
jgi:hypothetical protein